MMIIDARDKGDRQITGVTTQFRRPFIFRHSVHAILLLISSSTRRGIPRVSLLAS